MSASKLTKFALGFSVFALLLNSAVLYHQIQRRDTKPEPQEIVEVQENSVDRRYYPIRPGEFHELINMYYVKLTGNVTLKSIMSDNEIIINVGKDRESILVQMPRCYETERVSKVIDNLVETDEITVLGGRTFVEGDFSGEALEAHKIQIGPTVYDTRCGK